MRHEVVCCELKLRVGIRNNSGEAIIVPARPRTVETDRDNSRVQTSEERRQKLKPRRIHQHDSVRWPRVGAEHPSNCTRPHLQLRISDAVCLVLVVTQIAVDDRTRLFGGPKTE